MHIKYPEQILYTGSERHVKKLSLTIPWSKQNRNMYIRSKKSIPLPIVT